MTAAAKRREKQEEIAAKQRIKDKIAADKEERRLKAEAAKAERLGQAPAVSNPTASTMPVTATSKPASAYKETRLRLQTPTSTITKSFPVETTLFEVASAVTQEIGGFEVSSFTQNFPKKSESGSGCSSILHQANFTFSAFDSVDFGASLKELSLVPSASLIVK